MELYPAIDLRGGRCVRLAQGDFGRETVYGTEPVERAKAFEAAGARWVHVVDLDAVRSGVATNRPVIADIAAAVGIAVQAGGGVRRAEDVAGLLDAGVARVIVGTAAVTQEGFLADVAQRWPGRVGAAVDHFNGEVRVRGWAEGFRSRRGHRRAKPGRGRGRRRYGYRDSRDGLMVGPDLAGYRSLLRKFEVPLIASGGVGTVDDIRRLAWLHEGGRHLAGVIVGRAIYEGRFTVPEAVAAARGVPV